MVAIRRIREDAWRAWLVAGCLLAVGAFSGCADYHEEYSLNPDGSGKLRFEVRNLSPSYVLGDWEHRSSEVQKPWPEMVDRLVREYMADSRGFAAIDDYRVALDESGLVRLSLTLYFPDLAKVGWRNPEDYRFLYYPQLQAPTWTRTADGRFRFALFDRPIVSSREPPPPSADGEWLRVERQRWKRMADQRFSDAFGVREMRLRTAAAPRWVDTPDPADGDVCRLEGVRLRARMETAIVAKYFDIYVLPQSHISAWKVAFKGSHWIL